MAQVLGMAASLYDVDLSRQQRVDALQWRSEDIQYRNETIEWRKMDILWRQADLIQRDLDNRRREIDEKNEQLRQLANVAAIIAGFALTVLVQISYPDDVPEFLLTLLALATAVTVCCMVYSALVCTLMLVATLKKFEGKDGGGFQLFSESSEQSTTSQPRTFDKSIFELFWETQCASDWSRAVHAFSYGLSTFLIDLLLVGWVRFYPLISPGILVSVICIFTLLFIIVTVNRKWLNYLFLKRKPMPSIPSSAAAIVGMTLP